MSETELSRLMRQAKRSEPAAPPLASVLARAPTRRRLRAALAGSAAAVAGLAVAVFVAGPEGPQSASPSMAAAELALPLSTDWLAEPMGADLLATVPPLTLMGADYADF